MTRLPPLLLAVALMALPLAVAAATLSLPAGAALNQEAVEPAGRYALPIGPWTEAEGVEILATSGKITRQAWRIGGTGLSSYQILLNLRAQLEEQDHEILFECGATTCGGFDFRFGTEVIGEPAMHVDLGDYHFLAARKPGALEEFVSLLVSRSASSGYVQVVQVGEMAATTAPEPMASTKAVPGSTLPAAITGDVGPAMEQVGRFVLADLVFETGSADLGPGSFTSLSALADYLNANPAKRVALVGHTDAEGSLAGNIALSKRRAGSVMQRLIADFGVASGQLEAEGVGYLSPLASNQSDEGRTVNRRVEAILVSTE